MCNIFNIQKKRRGIIRDIKAIGDGWLNKGHEYTGAREVIILEETRDMYKVKFVDEIFQKSDELTKWWAKEKIETIE